MNIMAGALRILLEVTLNNAIFVHAGTDTCPSSGGGLLLIPLSRMLPLFFVVEEQGFRQTQMMLVALPLGYFTALVLGLEPWIAWVFMLLEEPIKSTVGFVRLRSRKWLHDVTK